MNFSFHGKTFLVTGAGRGIGRALVKELANSGGEVFALSRTKETLDSLAKETDRVYPIMADVSDWNNLREIVQNLNALDGVVNNAAYHLGTGPVAAIDCPKKRFDTAYNTNTLAAINIIQMAGKKMRETGKRGSIVNVSR